MCLTIGSFLLTFKPAVGGLGLGILGYFIPRVFGTGFDTISNTLTGQLGLGLLAILIVGKILATVLTLGSGASGGVFAPALFIGAVLGGRVWPDRPINISWFTRLQRRLRHGGHGGCICRCGAGTNHRRDYSF